MSDTREDSWTSDWIIEKLASTGLIKGATKIDANHIVIVDGRNQNILVATMSSESVELDDIKPLLDNSEIQFLVNVSKNSVISGSVLSFGVQNKIGIGEYGDLMSALGRHKYRNYVNKEADFIINGLMQHTAVSDVKRLNNRAYEILRHYKSNVTIVTLNDYDLTASSVRNGVRKYGPCDAVLTSNPNCRQSDESKLAASAIGIRILKWSDLLGALNNENIT